VLAGCVGDFAGLRRLTWLCLDDSCRLKPGAISYLITPDLTLSTSAAATTTPRLLTLVFRIGSVLLPSLFFLFRVFKGSQSK
jgi:hypothetical protein